MENEIGSLQQGKYADIVVLNKSPFDVPVNDIHNIQVEMTIMDGKTTYDQSQVSQ